MAAISPRNLIDKLNTTCRNALMSAAGGSELTATGRRCDSSAGGGRRGVRSTACSITRSGGQKVNVASIGRGHRHRTAAVLDYAMSRNRREGRA